MRSRSTIFLKTATSLMGTMLMLSGDLLFTDLSLLDYMGVKNKPFRIFIGTLACLSSAHVLIFTRGIGLWKQYSYSEEIHSRINTQPAVEAQATNSTTRYINHIGIGITGLGCVVFFSYSLFASFLASETLLQAIDCDNFVSRTTACVYIWFSLVVVSFKCALPRAIKNGKEIATLLCFNSERPDEDHLDRRRCAMFKTIIFTSLGTISFGTLALFFTENSIQVIPIIKDVSKTSKQVITSILSVSIALMFGLTQSLEPYQYLSSRGQYDTSSDPPPIPSPLLYAHQIIGGSFLVLSFFAYTRSNLNFLQYIDVDVELKISNIPWFVLIVLCSISSTFIDYVFCYQNMMAISRINFQSPVLFWRGPATTDLQENSDLFLEDIISQSGPPDLGAV